MSNEKSLEEICKSSKLVFTYDKEKDMTSYGYECKKAGGLCVNTDILPNGLYRQSHHHDMKDCIYFSSMYTPNPFDELKMGEYGNMMFQFHKNRKIK